MEAPIAAPPMRTLPLILTLALVAGCDSGAPSEPFAVGDSWGARTFDLPSGGLATLDLEFSAVGARPSGAAVYTGGRDVGSAASYQTTFSGSLDGSAFTFSTGSIDGLGPFASGARWTCEVESDERMTCNGPGVEGVEFRREI